MSYAKLLSYDTEHCLRKLPMSRTSPEGFEAPSGELAQIGWVTPIPVLLPPHTRADLYPCRFLTLPIYPQETRLQAIWAGEQRGCGCTAIGTTFVH